MVTLRIGWVSEVIMVGTSDRKHNYSERDNLIVSMLRMITMVVLIDGAF